jgi:hypothetical protein
MNLHAIKTGDFDNVLAYLHADYQGHEFEARDTEVYYRRKGSDAKWSHLASYDLADYIKAANAWVARGRPVSPHGYPKR